MSNRSQKPSDTIKAHQTTACVINVRTSSSRLPSKTLSLIRGKRVIEHLIDRLGQVRLADQIIVCTSIEPGDDILECIAMDRDVYCFRGSLDDVLSRWLGAAETFNVDRIVEVDGDDLFCDPELIDLAIRQMHESPSDLIKPPDGLVPGGFTGCLSVSALRRACEIKDTIDTHNWMPFFIDTGLFKVDDLRVTDKIFFAQGIRLTLDYAEDLEFFRKTFDELNMDSNNVPLRNILQFLIERPELPWINLFRHQDYEANRSRFSAPKIKVL